MYKWIGTTVFLLIILSALHSGAEEDLNLTVSYALDEYEQMAAGPFDAAVEDAPSPETLMETQTEKINPPLSAPQQEPPATAPQSVPVNPPVSPPTTGANQQPVFSNSVLGSGHGGEFPVSSPQDMEDLSDDLVIQSLEFKDMDISDVLKVIAQKSGMNIIAGKGVAGKVTIYLSEVKLKDALRIILDANSLAYKVEDKIIRVMPAKEFENRYGYVFGGEWETRIVRLVYTNVGDMVTVLNQMKSPSGKIVFDPKSNTMIMVESPERLKVMERLIQEIDVPVETQVFELSYVRAKDVAEKIAEVLTQNVGQIKFDERSNKIIITDTRLKIDKISRIIEAFDVKGTQVLIEAKIVQVVLSHQHQFGVDWEALAREYQGLNFSSQFDVLNSNDKHGKVTIGTLSEDDYTALLEMLKTEGLTNILSSPSITTLNNEEAKILIGSQEPYVTTTTTTPSSGPTTTAESITFLDVGIELNVTPTIHRDQFITMKIKPEVSSVTKTITTSNNNTIPVVETSEAETTVTVKDGVTIVIGGLIKDEKIRTDNKVPLLGDIPLVGYAFRNHDDLVRKTEIVIFLTPRIISGDVPGNETLERLRNVKKAGPL